MARLPSYNKRNFSPLSQILAYDPSGQVTSLIPGQSLLDYIGLPEFNEALISRVQWFTTNDVAKIEDLPLGRIIYTGGNTTIADGGGGHYVVVESGGSVVLDNGFELLLLPLGDLTGSDATNALATTSTGTQTLATAFDDRVVRVGSVAGLADVTPTDEFQFNVRQFWPDSGYGGGLYEWQANRSKTEHDGGKIIDPDKLTELVNPGLIGTYFTPAGSGTGCFVLKTEAQGVYANWYGAADTSIVANNTPFVQQAVDANKSRLRSILFEAGDYTYSTQLNLTGNPVAFIGEAFAPWQQGSTLPPVAFTWTGGAIPSIACNISNIAFIGIAVQNKGSGSDFLELNAGAIRYWFHRCSFLLGTGTTPWTRSSIRSNGNRLGYSKFTATYCINGVAPRFLDIDGQGSTNGITPIYFGDRCIFESGAGRPMTVVYIKDEVIDTLTIENCTFNQQGDELCIVDTTDTPLTTTIREFNFNNNEWDYSVSGAATDRMLRLTNVNNAIINGNDMQMGGLPSSAIELVNTRLASFEGNGGQSVATSVINADSASRVNLGQNNFNKSNVPRIVNDTAEGLTINISWVAGNVFIVGEEAPHNVNTTQVISPADGSGWTLTYRHGSQGYFAPGQLVTVQIRNESGGAISAGTPAGSIKTAGALVAPADGFSRFYTFKFTGSGFMEISRSAADVANI